MSWLIEYWYVAWGLIWGSIFIALWVYVYRHRDTSLGTLLRYCAIKTVRSAWVLLLGSALMFLFPVCVLLAYPEQIAPVPEERVSDSVFFSVFLSIWFPITGGPVALASWALFSSRGRQYLNEQETLSSEKPRRLRSLTLLLLVFAPVTLLSTKLFEVYSKHIELPALAADTAPNVLTSSCHDYKSALPDRAPKTANLCKRHMVSQEIFARPFTSATEACSRLNHETAVGSRRGLPARPSIGKTGCRESECFFWPSLCSRESSAPSSSSTYRVCR